MSLPPEQIDGIVREVIRRLQEQGIGIRDETPQRGGELHLSERVVTTETLASRLTGVAVVRVARQAVVTPAARDLLRERHVELIREG